MPEDKLVEIMAKYDASEIGTPERVAFGAELDRLASKAKERTLIRARLEYEKILAKSAVNGESVNSK